MNNLKIAVLTLATLLIVLFMHVKGIENHLYLTYWFYDIIVHFLGGVGIALASLYIFKNPKYIIPASIFAGIIWELFEICFNITGSKLWTNPYYIDTVKDLFDDTLGAVFVYLIIKK
jgi:uncharacterized BrkB/YihY/UPF0761 family membrane protein